jgi:hypothetical protein
MAVSVGSAVSVAASVGAGVGAGEAQADKRRRRERRVSVDGNLYRMAVILTKKPPVEVVNGRKMEGRAGAPAS